MQLVGPSSESIRLSASKGELKFREAQVFQGVEVETLNPKTQNLMGRFTQA